MSAPKMIDAFVLKGAMDASIEKVPMPPAPGPYGLFDKKKLNPKTN